MAPLKDSVFTQDDAVRAAVHRAKREGGVFAVYHDSAAYYVRAAEAAKPKATTLVCMAERWDVNTIQVRYAGARSEWVRT